MHTPETSLLGREVAYPQHYDPSLLFPIPRAQGRDELGIRADVLPFIGHDRWQGYELGWLDGRGKPQVATAVFEVPATSPNLIESKSFKHMAATFVRFLPDRVFLRQITAQIQIVSECADQSYNALPYSE